MYQPPLKKKSVFKPTGSIDRFFQPTTLVTNNHLWSTIFLNWFCWSVRFAISGFWFSARLSCDCLAPSRIPVSGFVFQIPTRWFTAS